jgi:hypothetical protein
LTSFQVQPNETGTLVHDFASPDLGCAPKAVSVPRLNVFAAAAVDLGTAAAFPHAAPIMTVAMMNPRLAATNECSRVKCPSHLLIPVFARLAD